MRPLDNFYNAKMKGVCSCHGAHKQAAGATSALPPAKVELAKVWPRKYNVVVVTRRWRRRGDPHFGSFKVQWSILFAISTIFSVTYCYELPFGLSMPNWFNSFTGLLDSSPRALSEFESDLTNPTLTEIITKITWDIFGYMATMLGSVTRRMTQMRPNVEMAPGSFKTEILKYPENYFVNRLKTLLKIKKREEEMNKPLNKPERI